MAARQEVAVEAPALEIRLEADRVTKGAVRFVDPTSTEAWPLQIYLRKEQVAALGVALEEGAAISLRIEAA